MQFQQFSWKVHSSLGDIFCTNVYSSDLFYSSVETVSRLKFGNRVWGGLRVPSVFFSPVGAQHNEVMCR